MSGGPFVANATNVAAVAVAADGRGNLYIVDNHYHRFHRVWLLNATTGLLSVVAGTGDYGFSGDEGPLVPGCFLSF